MKFGVALGSGGARGIAHLGFLAALKQEGVMPDIVCGSSMGAIAGALFCAGTGEKEILEELRSLSMRRIAKLDPLFFRHGAIFKNTRALRVLTKFLADKTFDRLPVKFGCATLDLNTGKTFCLTEGQLAPAVMASSSIPGIFPPMKMGDMLCVDGGVVNKVPVDMCRQMGADVVLGVDALGDIAVQPEQKGIAQVVKRAFYVMNFHTGLCERGRADKLFVLPLEQFDPSKCDRLEEIYLKGKIFAQEHMKEIAVLAKVPTSF